MIETTAVMDDIGTVRSPHGKERPYVAICRETLQDRSLSWEARGVLGYLLSKPDDWEVMISDLMQECGRDKVYAILKELREHRYLRLVNRRQDGRFAKSEYQTYETPYPIEWDQESPYPEKPDREKPDREKPPLHNKEKKQIKEREREDRTPPPIPEHIAAMQRAMSPDLGAYLDAWRNGHGDHKPIALRGRSRTEALEDAEELVKMGVSPQDMQDYTAQRKAANKSTAWKFIIQDFHIFMAQKTTQAVQEQKKTQAAATRFYDPATDTTNTWDMINQMWIYEKGNTLA